MSKIINHNSGCELVWILNLIHPSTPHSQPHLHPSATIVTGGGGDVNDWVCSFCVTAGELDLVLLFDEKKMC